MFRQTILRSARSINPVRTFFKRGLMTEPHTLNSAESLGQAAANFRPSPTFKPMGIINISSEVQTRLMASIQGLPSPFQQWEAHCKASFFSVLSQLPPTQVAEILAFRSSPGGPGALLIRGLPVDRTVAPTPSDGKRSMQKKIFTSESCLTGIAKLIGEPLSFASEKDGEPIHNVAPVRNSEATQSNESSRVELDLHVENAFFNNRPDFLALYCLRQDHKKEALTSFVDVRSILSQLDPTYRAELAKPVFVVPSPESHHKAMGGVQWSAARPVVEDVENPKLICHFPGMKALDPAAQKALEAFEVAAHLPNAMMHVALQPGNLLLLNNRRVAHGRSFFEPRYDGKDRWLQRMYIQA